MSIAKKRAIDELPQATDRQDHHDNRAKIHTKRRRSLNLMMKLTLR